MCGLLTDLAFSMHDQDAGLQPHMAFASFDITTTCCTSWHLSLMCSVDIQWRLMTSSTPVRVGFLRHTAASGGSRILKRGVPVCT